jgi:hypothetical protein
VEKIRNEIEEKAKCVVVLKDSKTPEPQIKKFLYDLPKMSFDSFQSHTTCRSL